MNIATDPEKEEEEEEEDICGLCFEPGADKMARWTGGGAVYWPGERRSESEFVHADCESEETRRAHAELSQDEIRRILRGLGSGLP